MNWFMLRTPSQGSEPGKKASQYGSQHSTMAARATAKGWRAKTLPAGFSALSMRRNSAREHANRTAHMPAKAAAHTAAEGKSGSMPPASRPRQNDQPTSQASETKADNAAAWACRRASPAISRPKAPATLRICTAPPPRNRIFSLSSAKARAGGRARALSANPHSSSSPHRPPRHSALFVRSGGLHPDAVKWGFA